MLLLQAQIDLENWRFLLTLLNIHGANTRIAAWEKSLQNREVRIVYIIMLRLRSVFSVDNLDLSKSIFVSICIDFTSKEKYKIVVQDELDTSLNIP